jgi:hypothetical protein
MKIFGVSLGRNATQSLSEFLKEQGFSVTHFYEHLSIPLGAFEESLKGILDHFDSIPETDAYIDIPTCFAFEAMYERFPDAKFINIVRPIDDWIISMQKINRILAHDGPPSIFEKAYCNFYQKTGKNRIQDLTADELKFIATAHLTKIKEFFQDKDNYLEVSLNDKDIAKKIIKFIGVGIESEFPWVDNVGKLNEVDHDLR